MFTDLHKARGRRIVVGRAFVTQSLFRNKERAFGECFKPPTGTRGNDLSHTIPDQPIEYLCRRCGTDGRLAKRDLLTLILGHVYGKILCVADKTGNRSGVRLACVFVNIAPEKGKNAFFRKSDIQFFMGRVDDRFLRRIKLQYRYLAFDDAHNLFICLSDHSMIQKRFRSLPLFGSRTVFS